MRFAERESPLWLRFLLVVMIAGILAGVFFVLKKRLFPTSMTYIQFATLVAEQFAFWTGALFWLVIVLGHIAPRLIVGRKVDIPEFAQVVGNGLYKIGGVLRNLLTAICALVVAAAGLLALVVVSVENARPLPPPSAGVLVLPTDSASSKLYLLDGQTVSIFDRSQRDRHGRMRPLQNFFLADAGQLASMAVTADERRIFVSDHDHGVVHILDPAKGVEESRHLDTGRTAYGMALSSDGRKLYVAVTGPAPRSRIIVFDAKSLALIHTIESVGCPISLFAAQRAPLLFVSTQCGAPEDPLYIFDTRDDRLLRKIPGFAVGSRVAATPDGEKIIVLSDDRTSIVTGWRSGNPAIRRLPIAASSLTISPDGQLFLIGTGKGLISIDTRRDAICRSVSLEAAPDAIAFTTDGWIFARLPDRIFIDHRHALECS